MKRWLSVLLVLCMVAALLPLGALAAENETGESATVGIVEETAEETTTEPILEETTGDTSAEPAEEIDEENAAGSVEPASEEMTEEITATAVQANVESTSEIVLDGVATGEVTLDGAATKYTLYTYANDYGSIEVEGATGSMFSYAAGETVTITAKPDSGYKVANGVLFDQNALSLEYTLSGNTFTFTMPASNAIFGVSFTMNDSYRVTMHEYGGETTVYYAANEYAPISGTRWALPEGKVLSAWAVNNDPTKLLREGDYYKFTADTDLYAVYAPAVLLTFHCSTGPWSTTVPKGEEVCVYVGDEVDGQVLIGWRTGSGEVILREEHYIFHEDTDLYPIYEDAYTVTLYYASGETYTELVPKGGKVLVEGMNRSGKAALKYWAVGSPDGAVRYLPGVYFLYIDVNEDMELYQVTTTDTVTITYNSNDSRNKSTTAPVPKDSDVILSQNATVYPANFGNPIGKELLGWSKTPDGEPLTSPCRFSSDTTLYAIWSDQLCVTYDANGGLGGLQATAPLGGYAKEYLSSDNAVNRPGYTLAGWATDKAGTQIYDFSKPLTGDLTLYAVWQLVNDSAPEKTDGGDTAAAPKAPARAPQTGDDSLTALWLALAAASALGLGYVTVRKKKN